ncbi:MAG: hypothetical protein ACLQGP_06365, partial [Isosphaeraceae bacterium]
RPPFQGISPMETLLQAAYQEPVSVTRLVPRVPRDLDTICLKCLEKDPAKRYATAADLAADLGRFLDREPILARPVGPLGRLARWGQRNPVPAMLESSLLLTGVVGLTAIVWEWRQAERARAAASALAQSEATARVAAQEDRVRAENAQRQAEHISARLVLDRGQALCERGEIGPGLLWLARGLEQAEAAGDADLIPAFRANLAAWAERLVVPQVSPPMKSSVTAVALHPDGRCLLVGQWANLENKPGPGLARVWDSRTWQTLGPPMEHPGAVRDARFSPDGRLILTGGDDGTARLWHTDTGQMIGRPMRHGQGVRRVAFAPDGRTLATGSAAVSGGEARIWDTFTGQPLTAPLPHPYIVRGLAFSPDGKTLLAGCGVAGQRAVGGEARFWDVASGRPVGPVLVHTDPVWAVAFSRDGQTILTGSVDGLVRQWDRETGERVNSPLRHSYAIMAIALSPDGRTLLTGGDDFYGARRLNNLGQSDLVTAVQRHEAAAYLWDLGTNSLLGGPWAHRASVDAVAFQPDGKGFATGCRDGHVRIWTLQASQPSHCQVLNGIIARAAFSRDGRYLALGGERDKLGAVWLLDVTTGRIRELLPGTGPLPGAGTAGLISRPQGRDPLKVALDPTNVVGSIHCVASSSEGRTAATTGSDGQVRFWELATGRPIGPPLPLGGATDTRVAFSPDGRTFVTSSKEGPVQVWETATRKPIGPPLVGSGSASVAVFSPDGRFVATAGRSGIIALWDPVTGRSRARFPEQPGEITALAYSHDGRTLLVGSKGYARLFDASSGGPLGPPLEHGPKIVWEAEFSRDDMHFLTLAGDEYRIVGSVQVWEADSGRPVGPPMPHLVVLSGAAFHPDGRFIATGDTEGNARLWDAKSGAAVGPVLAQPGTIQTVVFSPDGQTLAVGGRDGTLTLWPVPAPVPGEPERIRYWVQSITGQELDDSGAVHDLSPHDWEMRREALRGRGGPPSKPR